MSIYFATPMYGSKCYGAFHKSAMQLAIELTRIGMPFSWSTPWNESLIPRARNNLVAEFLQTDFDYLMFIDADIEFSVNDVNLLWELNAEVSVGAYRMKQDGSPLTVWRNGKLDNIEGETEPFECDFAGTGFMLIQRAVIEKMQLAYPQTKYEEKGEKYALFDTCIIEDTYLSEDYTFCKRFRSFGGKIICHPQVSLKHWGLKAYG